MVHSRDDQEVNVAYKIKSPENQPQFSQMTMGKYWTKPKQAFRSTQNAFKKYFVNLAVEKYTMNKIIVAQGHMRILTGNVRVPVV